MKMILPSKILAAAVVAAAIPLAGPAAAAPLSQSLALNSADVGTVEQVQYRRGNRSGRWIGPAAAGFAAGAIIGGALAPRYDNDGYYAYGAAPGYVEPGYAYGAAPGYVVGPTYGSRYGYDSDAPSRGSSARCSGDRETNSAYPSWMCR
jgi:hypothetical protein